MSEELPPVNLIDPPLDDLMERSHSRFALVTQASKRARQVNSYRNQLAAGMLTHVGPLVPAPANAPALSIALREIAEGKVVTVTPEESSAS